MACVASDNGLAVGTESGEEHFHLGDCCVLGFVQNDEGALECATAHVGEGCHFDGARFFVTLELLGRQKLGEAVVNGSKVGGDLFFEVAGQVT